MRRRGPRGKKYERLKLPKRRFRLIWGRRYRAVAVWSRQYVIVSGLKPDRRHCEHRKRSKYVPTKYVCPIPLTRSWLYLECILLTYLLASHTSVTPFGQMDCKYLTYSSYIVCTSSMGSYPVGVPSLTSTGSLAKKRPWERRKFGGQSGHLPPWAKQADSLRRPASVQGSSSKIQRAFGPSAKLHGPWAMGWDGTREIALAAMTTRCICRGGRSLNRLAGARVVMSKMGQTPSWRRSDAGPDVAYF